jgi:hypothetical protein
MTRHLDSIWLDVTRLDNGRGADTENSATEAQKQTARGETARRKCGSGRFRHKLPLLLYTAKHFT